MLTKTVPAMNIAVISVDAMPTLGGVSSMAHHLANAFSRQGHETVFVGPRGSYVPGDQERLYHLYDDFRSNRKFLSAQDIIEEDLRIGSLLRDLFARYRIDHVLLAHPFHYGVMAVEIGGEMDIPVSALFHGFEIRSQLAEGYPRNLAKIISERRVETLHRRRFMFPAAARGSCCMDR